MRDTRAFLERFCVGAGTIVPEWLSLRCHDEDVVVLIGEQPESSMHTEIFGPGDVVRNAIMIMRNVQDIIARETRAPWPDQKMSEPEAVADGLVVRAWFLPGQEVVIQLPTHEDDEA